MTGSRFFGWITTAVALGGVGYFGYRMIELTLQDPHIDPLPAAIELLGAMYWVFLAALATFVMSKVMQFIERRE